MGTVPVEVPRCQLSAVWGLPELNMPTTLLDRPYCLDAKTKGPDARPSMCAEASR